MQARGHDVKTTVIVNGAAKATFRNANSVTINYGLESDEQNYVGSRAPRVSGFNGPATVTMEIEPDNTQFGELVALQRAANLPNSERTALTIDVTCSVDFGDGGRDRWAFPGCTLRAPSTSSSGRTARVTGSVELVCPEPRRI